MRRFRCDFRLHIAYNKSSIYQGITQMQTITYVYLVPGRGVETVPCVVFTRLRWGVQYKKELCWSLNRHFSNPLQRSWLLTYPRLESVESHSKNSFVLVQYSFPDRVLQPAQPTKRPPYPNYSTKRYPGRLPRPSFLFTALRHFCCELLKCLGDADGRQAGAN